MDVQDRTLRTVETQTMGLQGQIQSQLHRAQDGVEG